jgi:hypothetical protein
MEIPMASTAALIWYLVISGPQGGIVILPSSFDTREQCAAVITEYQKQPACLVDEGKQLQGTYAAPLHRRDEPNELQSRSLVKRRHRLSEHFLSYLIALVFQGLIEHPAPQCKPIAA